MRSHNINNSGRRSSFVLIALCLLSQLAIASSAQQTVKDEERYRELPNLHQVNARLYRGGQPRKGGIQKLTSLGVNTIINLRDSDEHERAEAQEAQAAGLRYFNIPFERLGRPTDEQVARVLSLIDAPENGVVFVHCAHGADRTGTVIAVYRISHDGWTSEQAKEEAARYGMKFWQRGMKDFIHDYYRDRAPRANPPVHGRSGHGAASG
jgi:protein tyrosine/serine phosphatase